jgi:hypothetical protein
LAAGTLAISPVAKTSNRHDRGESMLGSPAPARRRYNNTLRALASLPVTSRPA